MKETGSGGRLESLSGIRYYLGPFSAPFFLGHPERWIPGVQVPGKPFVDLRLYTETWSVEERWHDPRKVTRKLAYEYRAP